MATTQPNLSETAKVQIPQRAQPLHAVPFLRPHSCSEEPARPESHSEPRDVNGCDFTPISISILRMKELSEHIQKPSGLVFTFIRGISPGESGHTSTGTDYQHFVQNFLFSPPPSLYLSSWGPMQVVPSGPSEQLPAMLRRRPSLALSLGWHGGPGRKGLLGKHRTHTGDLIACWMFFTRGAP